VSSHESTKHTLIVALALCIVCSVVVSSAAVLLRPAQQANKELDKKANILRAAGLLDENRSVEEQFANVQTRIVDLDTGRFTDAVDAGSYDQRKAAKDPSLSEKLSGEQDIAKIGRRVKYATVYLVSGPSGIEKVILPIKGYGLWSTLYGFLALESDMNTVAGLGFYEHAETPGLGGEVDNPEWKAKWIGKKVYADGEAKLSVIKGSVDGSSPAAVYQVDGLSGATLTSKGVDNLIHFWMGQNGYAGFLTNLRAEEA